MNAQPPAHPPVADLKPVTADELLALRRQIWSDGKISPDEAGRLFAMNDGASPDADWTDAFVEALCDFFLARGLPAGSVSQADADWLVGRIGADGRVDSHAELELVVRLLERADCAPTTLKDFALETIERQVLSGVGPLRRGGESTPGTIDAGEVMLLRRLLFAPAGDGPAFVSSSEAEMLFRLKEATATAANDPEWRRLFVQGVANHLVGRQRMLPRRTWTPGSNRVIDMLKEAGLDEGYGAEIVDESPLLTAVEEAWLAARIDADGCVDHLEKALLDFLAAERKERAR